MKFSDFDTRMRTFETVHDYQVLPGMYMVARLDGRGFTRLTKERHRFTAPFDEQFRDFMIATTQYLMDVGFNIIYGYTQSDEISILFHKDEGTFGRKPRKLNSILAGEASAKFSTMLGDIAVFDCRISQLPNPDLVCDYFRWRAEDANRNALQSHCYWMLRNEGASTSTATATLEGMSSANKQELLFSRGLNFNDLPAWQKRGTGLYWQQYQKESRNQVTGEAVVATRRRIKTDLQLPMKESYNHFIAKLIKDM